MKILQKIKPITNFPQRYPLYKRIGGNITYFLSQIPIGKRKNLLSWKDIRQIRKIATEWDILLWGSFSHVSGIFIEWSVTHAMAYIGKGRAIHAFAQGVSFISLKKILRTYDSIIILRPYWKNDMQKQEFRALLEKEVGKPYDFYFWLEDSEDIAYFCTRLINDLLIRIGYETRIDSIHWPKNIIDKILDPVFRAHRVLKPQEMLLGNFEVVFYSHNIEKVNNSLELTEERLLYFFPELKEFWKIRT